MKVFITTLSLFAFLITNAQEKTPTESSVVKRETLSPINPALKVISVIKETDPATGFTKFYEVKTDKNGKEIKTSVIVTEDFDAAGNSILFINKIDAAGKIQLIPATLNTNK